LIQPLPAAVVNLKTANYPAYIVIPIGVGILAAEFARARILLRKVEGKIYEQRGKTEHNDKSG
jgi:hypothetical protein